MVDRTDSFISTEEREQYDWIINSMDTYLVQKVYLKKGSGIITRCFSMEDIEENVVVGIIDSSNTARSVEDIQVVQHKFEIKESGYYTIFVQNTNASTMDIGFVYYVL